MDLLELGDWGYRIGSVGIVVFTVAFLVVVRWWSDLLGRVIAGVFSITSGILLTGAYRTLEPGDTPVFLWWRAVIYVLFGVVIWSGIFTFIWVQFFAPRIKERKDKHNAEIALAGSRHYRDGNSDHTPGGAR